MKRIIALLAGVTVVGVMSGMAQGTLNFLNPTAQRVKTPEAVNVAQSLGYTVELLWGASESTINNVGGTTGFSSIAGIFNGGVLTLTGAAAGSTPWITVRIWDSKGGTVTSWAQANSSATMANPIAAGSVTWQLGSALGGPNPPNPDNPPSALTGFVAPTMTYLVPEPATYALLALGAAALMLRRRK